MRFLFPFAFACLFAISTMNVKAQHNKIYDPIIQTMVDKVNGDTLWNDIANLSALQRYSLNAGAIVSSNFLKNYFEALGFDTVYFQTYQSTYIPNVIAVKYGLTYPDSIVLVGAHYDVYASNAPGADDNASGTAAVMETGRTIMGHNYKRTIKLICFSGEEQGLKGSEAYASHADSISEKISDVITMDMIAYLKPGDPINSDLYSNTASAGLRDFYTALTPLYIDSFVVANVTYPTGAGSDVEPFWGYGFKAIFPCEGQYSSFSSYNHCSPYMHTANDILGTSANNKIQATKITKSVVAAVATLAELQFGASINEMPTSGYFLNVSPNPASTDVLVKYFLSENSDVKILICDIRGSVLETFESLAKSEGLNETTLSLKNFASGIYLIKLEIKGNTFTKKIIINH